MHISVVASWVEIGLWGLLPYNKCFILRLSLSYIFQDCQNKREPSVRSPITILYINFVQTTKVLIHYGRYE